MLSTVCGLVGIDPPQEVHLDGADLSPLLVGKADQCTRHQPLFWLLPAAGPALAMRDANYSLVAQRNDEFPRDRKALAALMKQIESLLRECGIFDEEISGSTFQKQMLEGFKDKDAEKLRGQYIRSNMFNESWIPSIKSGRSTRFQLFDLSQDPGQKNCRDNFQMLRSDSSNNC